MARPAYRILGSLGVSLDEDELALGPPRQRALLAFLLLNANRLVPRDRLIDCLWAERPPPTAATVLQGYVSQLRKLLEPKRKPNEPFRVLVTEGGGYALKLDDEQFDLYRFEQLLEEGREALARNRPESAAGKLREALSLWRGPALAEFAYESFAQIEIARLEELQLAAFEERIEADLARGRHAELIGELEGLVGAHPLRERLRAQLMLALYRAGRQSEALAAYQEARRVLVDEFGIEPNRALQQLERDILLQDSSLDLAQSSSSEPRKVGTLTLLFTDIEGSTRLLHRLGEGYAHLLTEHRRLLSEAFETKGGQVVDSHGDAFFVVFGEAGDAVRAAVAAQRALAGYPWPVETGLSVRIGLHTGEPFSVGSGYIGLDVHRTARICAAAHGGQVLLSGQTRALLDEHGLGGASLRDLGEHLLRDLPQPEQLFQLVIPDLVNEFPPVRGESLPAAAIPSPERSILIVATPGSEGLVALAEPLAASHHPHGLIVASLIEAGTAGSEIADATAELQELRGDLASRGIAARVAAFTSAEVGRDLGRLASEQGVDLILLERAADQLAEAFDEELVAVLTEAPCDVAICLSRKANAEGLKRDGPIVVPFGGVEHDWAALELGAWLASAHSVRLRLLGTASDAGAGRRDASRLLASASLAVQQLVGIAVEPLLLSPGAESILEGAEDAAIIVVGVSSRWEGEGLGPLRAELARAATPAMVFVRRGVRPGGLAPRESLTRFTWSLSDQRAGS
jgi:DNA-binding SARP family transcriptional activator